MMKTLRESLPSASEVLHQVGLERERPATSGLTVAAIFALGTVTGAALALLFPARGSGTIWQTLRERLHTARERVAAPTNGDGLSSASGAAEPVPASVATPG